MATVHEADRAFREACRAAEHRKRAAVTAPTSSDPVTWRAQYGAMQLQHEAAEQQFRLDIAEAGRLHSEALAKVNADKETARIAALSPGMAALAAMPNQ
jgi:hypothetical protein